MFWHFVRIMKITFYEIAKSICKTGSDEGKLSQLLRTLCKFEPLTYQKITYLLIRYDCFHFDGKCSKFVSLAIDVNTI